MSSVNLVARFGLIAVFLFAPIISADLAGSGPDIDTPADNTEYSETTWIGCDGSCSDPATLKLQFKQSSLIVQERVFMNVFETPSWLQNVEPPSGGWGIGQLIIELYEKDGGTWNSIQSDTATVEIKA